MERARERDKREREGGGLSERERDATHSALCKLIGLSGSKG